jgi:hypothetical protein
MLEFPRIEKLSVCSLTSLCTSIPIIHHRFRREHHQIVSNPYLIFQAKMTSRMTSSDPESTFVVHLDLKPISAKLQESNRRYFSRPLLLEAASKLEAAQAELRNDEDFSEVFAPALDGKLVKVWPPARLHWTGGMGINLNWTGWAAQGKHAPLDIGAHPRRPKFWGPLFRLSSNADVVEDEVEDEADMRILGT